MKQFKLVFTSVLCAFALSVSAAEDKPKAQTSTDARASLTTHKANEMIGATVQNKSGEKLGTVRDLAFEMPSGKLGYIVVASGGLLGLGADFHAVPPKAFSHETSTARVLSLDMAKDQWESSPKFKKDQLTNLNAYREQIDKHFADVASDDVKAQARIGDAKAEIKIKTPDISAGAKGDAKSELRLASDVIGKQVVTQKNEEVGKISDLLVDMKSGKVALAIISTGTLLKPADTRYAVATEKLSLGNDKNKVVLNADRNALERAEVFDADKWQAGGTTSGSAGLFKYQVADAGAQAEIDTDDAKKPSTEVSASAGAGATALSLVKEANRYVGEQAKDKLVQIRSEKSADGLTPNVWYVVFYDPTAALKATEVKFANGRMVDVKRPLRLLEATSRQSEPLDRSKIKIDSDKALQMALEQPALQNIKPTASEMRLERGEGGAPAWRVELWGAKASDAKDDVSLGTFTLSAEDGKVVKADIKTNTEVK